MSWPLRQPIQVALNFLRAVHALAKPEEGEPDAAARGLLFVLTESHGFSFDEDGYVKDENGNRKTIRTLMKHDVLAKVFGRGIAGVEAGIRDWVIDSAHALISKSREIIDLV